MEKNRVPAEAVRNALIHFIKKRNISIPRILESVDISRSRLYDYLKGNGRVSATTFVNLLTTIDVSYDELLLHIYLTQPELIDDTIKELGLDLQSYTTTPNEDMVYQVLALFEETHNTRLLLNVVRAINSQVVDFGQRYRLVEIARPTIVKFLKKRELYSSTDMLLFANIIRHVPYDSVKKMVGEMTNQVEKIISLEGYGLVEMDHFAPAAVWNVGLLNFQMLLLALENGDTENVTLTMRYIEENKFPDYGSYFIFVKKLSEVLKLTLNGQEEKARKLWEATVKALNFMVDDRFWPTFTYLSQRSYQEFIKPVIDYQNVTQANS
ncbi:helix-turn-helix domain-containing protein [Weissella sagaensis]|jgi:transcriptional regulator with XRE-family HTH domain|uniref:Helix-turn-helix domain-containing protein n=1 Tax=Weissella sagaensis TaxID=2559928 RepID=A0ABW1RWB3_9LACO|nr:helix-turn-helix transcriptional regulator [Weissella sagaensis]KAA8434244.1 helix-turn-helix transcriptional regulator [Weissella paramesenteroides]MBU7567690.1 helix-turn-helix transcriptional regulator [Weissella hellenica]KAA8436475.1 helix-turn-helix transcriptional regulator [Weissella paramesenteroides]QDJ58023.1 transcriptional regulator [Weissella hellenica]QEA57022.1 helix-turn-helix transcriptional regulator [Weissella hellenica]